MAKWLGAGTTSPTFPTAQGWNYEWSNLSVKDHHVPHRPGVEYWILGLASPGHERIVASQSGLTDCRQFLSRTINPGAKQEKRSAVVSDTVDG